MTEKTFLFYDLETTGLNPPFDQIVQFAAIRTDLAFNEIERCEWVAKLDPDVIPAPEATITHRTSIARMKKEGMSHFEMVRKIHQMINTPGTMSLGYNTLGFDDEFLRFNFYKNLLPPYTHQYANQCSRADVYPIVVMYYLFNPLAFKWPNVDGKLSFKLEEISAANQFVFGQAHNALVDVEATVALAKECANEKKMWDYLLAYFNKNIDSERIYALPKEDGRQYGLYVSGSLGLGSNFIAPCLFLGTHAHYKNQTLWLRLDLPELKKSLGDDFQTNTWVINKKFGEPGFLLPPNARYMECVSDERKEIVRENLEWLSHHSAHLEKIIDHYRHYTYPEVEGVDPSAALYINGFLTDAEQRQSQQFHHVEWKHRSECIDTMKNANVKALAIRILGYHDVALLSEEQKEIYDAYIESCRASQEIKDYKGCHKLTPLRAMQRIEEIKLERKLDDEQLALLDELAQFLG
ncbi:MAG: exonuclease domain-containing protein [Gammaproteobacteria bacterium]